MKKKGKYYTRGLFPQDKLLNSEMGFDEIIKKNGRVLN